MYQHKIFSNNFVPLLPVKVLSLLTVYNNNQHHKLKMVHDELSVTKCCQEHSNHAIFSESHQPSPYWKKSFFPLHNRHNQRGWVAAEQLTEDQLISWVRNHKSHKQERHRVTNAKTKPPGAWAGRTSLNTNIATGRCIDHWYKINAGSAFT